jgi:hypothetical protein
LRKQYDQALADLYEVAVDEELQYTVVKPAAWDRYLGELLTTNQLEEALIWVCAGTKDDE